MQQLQRSQGVAIGQGKEPAVFARVLSQSRQHDGQCPLQRTLNGDKKKQRSNNNQDRQSDYHSSALHRFVEACTSAITPD